MADITIAGARYVVVEEKRVTVDYYKTVRRHGVEVKEYAPYQYVAVTVREGGSDSAVITSNS